MVSNPFFTALITATPFFMSHQSSGLDRFTLHHFASAADWLTIHSEIFS